MTKYFCDRCEKEIPIATWSSIKVEDCYNEVRTKPGLYGTKFAVSEPVFTFSNVTLCLECAKQFNKLVMKFVKNS